MRFLSNFGCTIIFMCSLNFWHQQDSNSLFKESIGHVTSWCKCLLLTTPYYVLIYTYFDAFVLRLLNGKDHLPVFLDYVLKGSEEILLKAKIGQLPFFQKLHSQLTQGVHAEKRNIFVRITATLKEMDAFRILRNSNDKFPCHMHPYDEM